MIPACLALVAEASAVSEHIAATHFILGGEWLAKHSTFLECSSLAAAACERWDMICPPHDFLISSARSLQLVLTDSTNLPKADLSSALTLVKATQEQFLSPTSLPSLDLPLTMQYGMPIRRQRVGRKRTTSTGSTS